MPPTDSSGPVVLISWTDLSHLKPIELKSDHNRVLVRSLMNNFHFLHVLLVVCVLEPGEHHHKKWYVFKEIIHNYSLLPLWKKQVSWNYWVKWSNLMKKEGTCKNPSLYPRAQWHFGQKVLQGKKKKKKYLWPDLMRKHDKWRKDKHFITTRINPNSKSYLQWWK